MNGGALVSVKLSGSYVTIGYTQDGVNLHLQQFLEEIMTDVFGTRTPQDFQDMGMMATIDIPFIAIDSTDFLTVLNVGDKTTNTDGTLNTAGLVMGAGSYGQILGISAPLGTPWYFGNTFIRDDKIRQKLSSKAMPLQTKFVAIPTTSYTTVTAKASVLYSRSSL